MVLVVSILAGGVAAMALLGRGKVSKEAAVRAGADKAPQRIVSLAPNITEILFELGLGDKVVAVTNDSNWPEAAAKKEKVGTFWQPSVEAIISTRPGLVLTLSIQQHKEVAESLQRLGYNVLSIEINTIEQLIEGIRQISVAAGCGEQGEELAKRIEEQIRRLRTRYSRLEKVKTLWVVQTEPLRVAGRDTFVNSLIEIAGGENVVGPTIQKYPPIGAEQVITCGAEAIIQPAMAKGDIEKQQNEAMRYWNKYPNLPAVEEGRVYVLDLDAALRLGPRLGDGLETIGRCLHPEITQQNKGAEPPNE